MSIQAIAEVHAQFPILEDAAHFLEKSLPSLIPKPNVTDDEASVLIPVVFLRWTHDSIDSRMIFRHSHLGETIKEEDRPSVYRTLDQLLRGELQPVDMPPLEVVRIDRKLWCLSNRRLTDLKMFQACHQDRTIYAKCVLRFPNEKFHSASTSDSDGLAIRPREARGRPPASPMHLGANLFSQSGQTIQGLQRLTFFSPNGGPNVSLLPRIRKIEGEGGTNKK